MAPTGSGKTSMFSWLAAEIKQPVVILVHRRELATQAANRLREFGVDFGFILAGEPMRPWARVQIASVQTLVRRKTPPAGLVIPDEAHLSTASTWRTILDQYPRARILGWTATPWRLGGKPLHGSYDACVVVAHPHDLRDRGHLCQYTGFSYIAPDLSGIAKKHGEYDERQTDAAMRAPGIVTGIVSEWQTHARDLSTVVFAVSVEHSKTLCGEFTASGATAEHIDGSTPINTRRAILARVESGATRVLCNVGIAVEGLDIPRLKCCVLARPTMSLARAIQMMGRVRRPWHGLQARIHDHAFVIRQHGLPDQERDYTLHATRPKTDPLPSLTTCKKCLAIYTGPTCPACGSTAPAQQRIVTQITDAERFEFDSDQAVIASIPEAPKPPVRVAWDSVGRLTEGVFISSGTEQTQYGPRQQYLIRGMKRDYEIPGTSRLNALMRGVKIGDLIRIKYLGDSALPGGRYAKQFSVEVDRD